MIRKTVPLMNYVQVSKTTCYCSTAIYCLFKSIFIILWSSLAINPFYSWYLYLKQFLVYTKYSIQQLWCMLCSFLLNFSFMNSAYFLQAHQNVFRQLVDLIGITSIMEVNFYLSSCYYNNTLEWILRQVLWTGFGSTSRCWWPCVSQFYRCDAMVGWEQPAWDDCW